jgi:hypothetical protein
LTLTENRLHRFAQTNSEWRAAEQPRLSFVDLGSKIGGRDRVDGDVPTDATHLALQIGADVVIGEFVDVACGPRRFSITSKHMGLPCLTTMSAACSEREEGFA